MIAGLEEASGGEIRIGERLVNNTAPKDRNIAMVFQNYALYPHKTVYGNMAFALRAQRLPKPTSSAACAGRRDLGSRI
jgi:multiple sugar transport system ATP-binding protein